MCVFALPRLYALSEIRCDGCSERFCRLAICDIAFWDVENQVFHHPRMFDTFSHRHILRHILGDAPWPQTAKEEGDKKRLHLMYFMEDAY